MYKELLTSIDINNNKLFSNAISGTKGDLTHMKGMLINLGYATS